MSSSRRARSKKNYRDALRRKARRLLNRNFGDCPSRTPRYRRVN